MRLRVRSEHGMALPLALGIMLVLSIVVYAVIDFSSASSRNSSLNERRQSAKALAEAGIAHGASFLAEQGESYHTTSTDTGLRTAAIQGVNVTWRATYAAPIWTVRATAAPNNPTGPGASDVSRTVEAKFEWTPAGDPPLWRGLYIGNPTIRPLLSDSKASIETNVYARGDLKLTQGKYLGESFQVWGALTLDSSVMFDTSIGASDRVSCGSDYKSFKSDFPAPCSRSEHRVPDFRVKDGCRFNTSDAPTDTMCEQTSANGGPNGKIWLPCPTPCSSSNVASTAFSDDPDDMLLTAPSVPPATYDLGPTQPCVTTTGTPPSFTSSTFELMTGSSYSCRNADGTAQLSWDSGTNELTVDGDIYFTQNMKLQSGRWGLFGDGGSEDGRIFIGGQIELSPGTALCGKRGSAFKSCDNDEGDWDPETANNVVTFITGSTLETSINQDSFNFQGGLNTKGGYLVQGTSNFKGPLIIEGPVEIKNSGVVDAYAPFNSPSGPSGGTLELTLVRGSWNG